MSKWRNLDQNGFTFHHVKFLIMERCPKNSWWKSSEAAAKRSPQPSRRSSRTVTSQQHQVCCQSLRICHRKQTVPGSDFLKGLWHLVIRTSQWDQNPTILVPSGNPRPSANASKSDAISPEVSKWTSDEVKASATNLLFMYLIFMQMFSNDQWWYINIHWNFFHNFGLSIGKYWESGLEVLLQSVYQTIQHLDATWHPSTWEFLCFCVLFLAGNPLLYPTLLLSQITNLENKNPPREFSESPQNQHHQETRIASELQGSHLGHLMRCKPGKTKALHRCSDQHTSTNPEQNSLIHVFGLAVVFCSFFDG